MYLPSPFEETRADVLHRLIDEHPLGLLVTVADGKPRADSIPWLLDVDAETGQATLRGHVARANALWKDAAGREALIVFQGPQAYVSPSMYPSKAETGKAVPTWNYVMVQARGPLRPIDDAAWLGELVSRLTNRHEATRPEPWKTSDAPAGYIPALLRAVVGIEIPLSSLVGKWKVSQNRTPTDRDGVVAGLRQEAARHGNGQAAAMAALVAAKP